ncbi:MAG: putative sulfate exporter family transporter [Holophagaceae bacterium]
MSPSAPHPAPSPRPQAALPLLFLGALLALAPFTPAAAALVGGALLALTLGNPRSAQTRAWTHRLLPLAVMGLGADMNLRAVARAGLHGLGYTAASLALVLALGLWLARVLKVDREAGLLISVGTAICGGSAIAAVAPVIRAREQAISIALATVFLLNAAALVIFPPLGHLAGLGQEAFGLWSALAIHDTSSVVGAGLAYGPRALEVATTVKLARALWIVPLTLGLGWMVARRGGGPADAPPMKKPWFIAGFLATAALATFIPALQGPGHLVASASRRILVLTLFLIGAGLSREALRSVGLRPFLQGLLLWLIVGSLGLGAVKLGLLTVG